MVEAVLLLLIAGGVVYYLYITLKEYMSNENNQKRFITRENMAPQIEAIEPTLEQKIAQSEFGTLAGILGYVANADGEICNLEQNVANSMLEEMAQEMSKYGNKQEVYEILQALFSNTDKNIQDLTERYAHLSKGEYRKKLKVVEFCFVLGYADGVLNDATKESIIDIAALLELDNQDFNGLYEDFAQENHIKLSLQEAKEIFGDTQDLDARYQQLIAQTKQPPTNDKNIQKLNGREQLLKLQQIHQAYEMLKSQSASSSESRH
ncbi:TerB family tellurite resistance protein [Helicobacter pametensis]|uniref:TerB family tellurite resistance protein n=1 Tax=Helicobacter pametensis TaxID=95149 RepID=UPI000486615A|nr:TerB family tellurite resistance protein [Helicobacter pametensis]